MYGGCGEGVFFMFNMYATMLACSGKVPYSDILLRGK